MFLAFSQIISGAPIDREALVRRHNVHSSSISTESPLTIGNGEFAFTADVTGLQTLNESYRSPPLQTMSHWGWHTVPARLAGVEPRQFVEQTVQVNGHVSHYPTNCTGQTALCDYLRANPHRLNLARVFLRGQSADLDASAIGDISQQLDLWTGTLRSNFSLSANGGWPNSGVPVAVVTAVHPTRDALALRVCSPLVAQGELSVGIAVPYGDTSFKGGSDWSRPSRHESSITSSGSCDPLPLMSHTLDNTTYHIRLRINSSDGACHSLVSAGRPHDYTLARQTAASPPPASMACLEATLEFDTEQLPSTSALTVGETLAACREHWPLTWQSGAAVEFSGSRASGATELERRVVLSQYIMMSQEAGSNPPQETGLMLNSWFGKFHLEMRWHHQMHFHLWDRGGMAERADPYFERARPLAQWHTAARQGFAGVRWPKMVAPPEHMSFEDGFQLFTGPSGAGPWLLWQQPHPIAFAEMSFRAAPHNATLHRYRQLIADTADFMADFVLASPADHRGCRPLGPPVFTAELESNGDIPATQTSNPTFEVTYWRFGLGMASRWWDRMQLPVPPGWTAAELALCPPAPQPYAPAHADVYFPYEHSSTFAPSGYATQLFSAVFAPTSLLNASVLEASLLQAVTELHALTDLPWCSDPPMYAMAAARLGLRNLAAELLVQPNGSTASKTSDYLPSGQCRMNTFLPTYTPGNGALLAAVAMLAGGGWDGDDGQPLPGLPRDGSWVVRAEGFAKAL